MATQTKRTNSRRKPKGSGRAGDGKGPGSQADLLQAMAKGLGNRELEQRLQRASGRRDDLLSLIADRLQKIRQVQIQESVLLQQKDKWWRDAAWREPRWSLPTTFGICSWKRPVKTTRSRFVVSTWRPAWRNCIPTGGMYC